MFAIRRVSGVVAVRLIRQAVATSSAALHTPAKAPAHPIFSQQQRGRVIRDDALPPKPRLSKADVSEKVVGTLRLFDRFPKDKADKRRSPLIVSTRGYCGPYPNTVETVEKRVVLVMQLFDKIKNPDQITMESHIINDLGLDSLDHVEIMMAMEDEFQIEIPDGDAERLLTPQLIAQYICDHDEIYE